jgi:hypothetical protein
VRTLDAIVIGAGPAGLAVSQQLTTHGLQHRVLEKGAAPGESWRNYYDSLVLHTAKHGSYLPGMPFAKTVPLFPSRRDVLGYLESYAAHFQLPIDFKVTVTRVARDGAGFQVATDHGIVESKTVIVATGIFSNPYAPHFENQESFKGCVIHSSEYRRADSFIGSRTLVVGAGNSGAEIAAELAGAGVDVSIAIRSGVAIQPILLLGIPIQYWGIFLHHLPRPAGLGISRTFAVLAAHRQKRSQILPPRLTPLPMGRVPVIGDRLVRAVRDGRLRVVPGIAGFESDGGVSFSDGAREEFSHIILATGYRPSAAFVEGAEGQNAGNIPGLFHVGQNNSLAGTLWHIRHEAEALPHKVQTAIRLGTTGRL